jgi:hypothetical protein
VFSAWAGATGFCMLGMGSPLADRVDAGQRYWSATQYAMHTAARWLNEAAAAYMARHQSRGQ